MADYLPIVLLLFVSTGFVFASFLASSVLGPKRRESAAKIGPYECGIEATQPTSERFPVRFYLVAMIFVIFDIEVIFLYPWAVLFSNLGLFGLVEMIVFSVAVVVSFMYLLSNGALDWGVQTRLADLDNPLDLSQARSSVSSIRRVPKEPRAEPIAHSDVAVELPQVVAEKVVA